eukprot:6859846-Karenia_brevis.AAC.1
MTRHTHASIDCCLQNQEKAETKKQRPHRKSSEADHIELNKELRNTSTLASNALGTCWSSPALRAIELLTALTTA